MLDSGILSWNTKLEINLLMYANQSFAIGQFEYISITSLWIENKGYIFYPIYNFLLLSQRKKIIVEIIKIIIEWLASTRAYGPGQS